MYALNNSGKASFWTGRALPRVVRRINSGARRCVPNDVHVPRHVGSLLALVYFIAVSFYALNTGGYAKAFLRIAASNFGFAISKVDIVGNQRISSDAIKTVLDLNHTASIIGFDTEEARAQLLSLPWVQSADVQKIYPNQLRITINERQPYAVWQHDASLDVVDRSGRVIIPFKPSAGFDNLPLVVGRGGEQSAAPFIDQLAGLPQIRDHVRAYVRVGERRWDLIMNNGLRIKLPEHDGFMRLKHALLAPETASLFTSDITELDLRLDDRVTVALSPEALARRQAIVKELSQKQKLREAKRT